MHIVFKFFYNNAEIAVATQMSSWIRKRPDTGEILINPVMIDGFIISKICYFSSEIKWKAVQDDLSSIDIEILEMVPDIRSKSWFKMED